MQFRLRTLIVLVTLAAVALGIQRYQKVLKTPVPLDVVYRLGPTEPHGSISLMPQQIFRVRDPALRTNTITEFANWKRGYYEPTDEIRVELLVQGHRMDWRSERDRQLLSQYRNMAIPMARHGSENATDTSRLFHFARILAFLGDTTGYDQLVQQVLADQNDGQTIPTYRISGFVHAPAEWLAEQTSLLKMLREFATVDDVAEIVKEAQAQTVTGATRRTKTLSIAAADILAKVGEVEHVLRIQRALFSSGAPFPLIAAEKILAAGPSAKDLANMLELMERSEGNSGFMQRPIGAPLADRLLRFDYSRVEQSNEWKSKVERRVLERARSTNTLRTEPARKQEKRLLEQSLFRYGSSLSAEFFRDAVNNGEPSKRTMRALNALRRIGFEDEWEQKLVEITESSTPLAAGLLDYLDIKGGNRIAILKRLIRTHSPVSTAAAVQLVRESGQTLDEESRELLIAEFKLLNRDVEASRRSRKNWGYYERLRDLMQILKTIDDPRIPSLRLEYESNHRCQEFVDWLNQRFPTQNLTVFDVEFGTEEIIGFPMLTGSFWQFQFYALANLNCGAYVDAYTDYEPGSVLMEMAATAGDELGFQAFSDTREDGFRFVVRDRTYCCSFDYWAELDCDWSILACLLNTIADDLDLSKRFFVYEGEWSDADTVVIYNTPKFARELEEDFGIKPANDWRLFNMQDAGFETR